MIPVINCYNPFDAYEGIKFIEADDYVVVNYMLLDKASLTQQYLGYLKVRRYENMGVGAITVYMTNDETENHPAFGAWDPNKMQYRVPLFRDAYSPNIYWFVTSVLGRIAINGSRVDVTPMKTDWAFNWVLDTWQMQNYIVLLLLDQAAYSYIVFFSKDLSVANAGTRFAWLGKTEILRNISDDSDCHVVAIHKTSYNANVIYFRTYKVTPSTNTVTNTTSITYTAPVSGSYYWETVIGAARETDEKYYGYIAIPSQNISGNCGIKIIYFEYDFISQTWTIKDCKVNPKTDFISEMGNAFPTGTYFRLASFFTSDGKLLITADRSYNANSAVFDIPPFAFILSIDSTDPTNLTIENTYSFTDIATDLPRYTFLSPDGVDLYFIFNGGLYKYKYNSIDSSLTYVTNIGIPDVNTYVIDTLNRLWVITNSNDIYLSAPDAPTTIDVRFANNLYTYSGEPIDTVVYVNVFDADGNRLAKNVKLNVISGNGVFLDSNGNEVTEITVQTKTDTDTALDFRIKGPGRITIDANLVI